MAHLLSCRLLDEACTADDLATVTERLRHAPASGNNCVKDTKEEEWVYCLRCTHLLSKSAIFPLAYYAPKPQFPGCATNTTGVSMMVWDNDQLFPKEAIT